MLTISPPMAWLSIELLRRKYLRTIGIFVMIKRNKPAGWPVHPKEMPLFFRKSLLLLLLGLSPALCLAAAPFAATNVISLRALTRVQMNRGRPFSLSGIITMAD